MSAEAFQQRLLQRQKQEQDELAAALRSEGLELVKELGDGGEGTTYLLQDGTQRYAGKFLSVEDADPQTLERLLTEAKVLQHLDQPRIPKYSGLVELPELGGILTRREFIDDDNGRVSLRNHLQEKSALPEEQVAKIMDSLCEIFEYLHDPAQHPAFRAPIVHRDVKPDNVFVDAENNAYLIDFGVARTSGAGQTTATAHVRGTHGYAAPEQYGGGGIPQSDLYALGVMSLEMLLGEKPEHFTRGYALRNYELPGNLGLSAGWKEVLESLVRLDPQERPESATAVRALLREKGLLREKKSIDTVVIDTLVAEEVTAINISTKTENSWEDNFADWIPEYDLADYAIFKLRGMLDTYNPNDGTNLVMELAAMSMKHSPQIDKQKRLVGDLHDRVLAGASAKSLIDYITTYELEGGHQKILGYTRQDIFKISDDLGFYRFGIIEHGLIHGEHLLALNNPVFRELLEYCSEKKISAATLGLAAENLRRFSKESDREFDKDRFNEELQSLESGFTSRDSERLRQVDLDRYRQSIPESLETMKSIGTYTADRYRALFLTLEKEGLVYREKGKGGEQEDSFRMSKGAEFSQNYIGIGWQIAIQHIVIPLIAIPAGVGIGYALGDYLGAIIFGVPVAGLTFGFIHSGIGDKMMRKFRNDTFNGSVIRTYSPEKKAAGLLQIYQAAETLQLPEETIPELIKDFGRKENGGLTPHELCEKVYGHLSTDTFLKAFPGYNL